MPKKKNNYDGIILCRPLIPIDNEFIGYGGLLGTKLGDNKTISKGSGVTQS